MTLWTDERGLSRLVSYMLTVAVAMILITGLLFAGGQLVEEQRERTMRSQLSVIGQQVAGSLEATDRLVRSTSDVPEELDENRPGHIRTLNVTRDLPETVVSSQYHIEVKPGHVIVRSMVQNIDVTIPFDSYTRVRATSVDGGAIIINVSYAASGSGPVKPVLEVQHA